VAHNRNSTTTPGARQLQAHVRRRAWHRGSNAPRAARRPRSPLGWDVVCGQPPDGGRCAARRPVARPWGVGRGEQIPLREHRRSAPRVLTVPNELANECLWGGSAPPNGSRLSCGRPARRRKSSGRQSVPARAQHSASFRTITARQLQALVRRPTSRTRAIDNHRSYSERKGSREDWLLNRATQYRARPGACASD